MRLLDHARGYAGIPFVITSGYRCPEHDRAVGGKGNHPTGKAADIRCATGPERLAILEGLIRTGFKRIGIGRDFIHVDSMDRVESIWLYT